MNSCNTTLLSSIITPRVGDYRPQRGDAHGSLLTIDYYTAVGRGLIPGASLLSGAGMRIAAVAETNVAVSPVPTLAIPPSTGVQVSFVSTSAADAAAGANIQQIHMVYLDVALNQMEEVITLSGVTPVTSAATNVRFVQSLHAHRYGTIAAAAGNITAYNGANVYRQISAGEARGESSIKMVPAGKLLYVHSFAAGSVSGTAAASTIIKFASTQIAAHNYVSPFALVPYVASAMSDSGATLGGEIFGPFTEGAIVGFIHTTDKAATITASWFGWLENAA